MSETTGDPRSDLHRANSGTVTPDAAAIAAARFVEVNRELARLRAEHARLREWVDDLRVELQNERVLKLNAEHVFEERDAEVETLATQLVTLRRYAQHTLTCDIGRLRSVPQEWPEPRVLESAGLPCNCGLDAALAATAPKEER